MDRLVALLEPQQQQLVESVVQMLVERQDVQDKPHGAPDHPAFSGPEVGVGSFAPGEARWTSVSQARSHAPAQLSPEVSLREFKVWCGAWADYEVLLQLKRQPLRTQLAHFRASLTQEMRSTLAHAIGVSESVETNIRRHPRAHQAASPSRPL